MHSQALDLPPALRQLWGVEPVRARGPKARFLLSDVVTAAIGVADAEGLEGVTLARVAGELGMTTTALYRYVDSKETLTELMVDAALGPPPRLEPGDWRARVRKWVGGVWARYLEHPWLAEFQPRQMPRCPNALGWMDALLAVLLEAGVISAANVAFTLNVLVRGFVSLHLTATMGTVPEWLGQEILRRFPNVAAAGQGTGHGAEGEMWQAVNRLLETQAPVVSGTD